MNKHARLAALATLASLLAACGGGGDGGNNAGTGSAPPPPAPSPSPSPSPSPAPATVKGQFIDAPVSNLGYSCGSGVDATSGVTDSNGAFDFVATATPTCTFAVGGVVLGSAAPKADGSALTPYDLVPGSTTGDPTVANIARFLQSIDDDGNPANGIGIQAETIAALAGKTLDFTSPSFDALAAALLPDGKTLVSATAAVDALNLSLFSLYAGSYSCTYSGKVNNVDTVLGTVAVTINYDTISGTGTPTYPPNGGPYPSFDLDGTLTPTGIGVSQTSTGATFDGNFSNTATGITGHGTWTDPELGSGTWDCHHL